MLNFIRQSFPAPVFDDEEKTRTASLLNSILWAVIAIGSIYAVLAPVLFGHFIPAGIAALIVIAGVIARIVLVRGSIRGASAIILTVFNVVFTASILVTNGSLGASYFSLVLTTVVAGALLGGQGAYINAGINSLIGLGILLYQDALPAPLIAQTPITFFTSLVVYGFFAAAILHASSRRFDKLLESLRAAQEELTSKNRELQKFAFDLESAIAARSEELDEANRRIDRRAKQFEAIARISRVISQSQNLDSLLTQVTESICEHFEVYHTGVFLLDNNSEYAVLIAANSDGGKRMLERGHKLRVGQTGIVGYVAGSGLPRIALDTGVEAIYFNNPDLPDTRSEIALPLYRKGNQVIGVLDVQSMEPNAFSHEDIRTLTTLADQVAIAIENARLFGEQERIFNETQAIYSRDFREGWVRFTRSKNIAGIQRRNMKTSILPEPLELPGADEVVRTGNLYRKIEEDGSSLFTIPIKLREQVVGILSVKSGNNRVWTEDELDIATAILQRAALSIENARLLEESRRTAEREHAIGEISARIGAGTQIEDILRTAVRELGARISGAQVTVEIGGGG